MEAGYTRDEASGVDLRVGGLQCATVRLGLG